MKPLLSVVICTYNRAGSLRRVVESLVDQSVPSAAYEIVIIDNGSTDETSEMAQRFTSSFGNVRYHLESRQGLSVARNAGWCIADGRYLAFLDDDAKASPDYVERVLRAFADRTPEPMGVGGRILPFYTSPRPHWFKDEYEIRDRGPVTRLLTPPTEYFAGSNMAFRRDVLERHGGFNEALA